MIKYSTIYDRAKESGEFRNNNTKLYQRIPNYFNLWQEVTIDEFKLKVRDLFAYWDQKNISNHILDNAYKSLRQDPNINISFADEDPKYLHYIYLANGVMDCSTMSLLPHGTLDINFRFAFRFSYIENANIKNAPVFCDFVCGSIGDDQTSLVRLLQMFCSILTASKEKAAYLFYGKSNSGKSVITELIKAAYFPTNVVTAVPLEKFSDNFLLASLSASRLNICSELSENCFKRNVVAAFKQVTARETINVSYKYENSFPATFHTTLLLCSNILPKISEEDLEPIMNRLEVMVFPNSIPPQKQDHLLLQKMLNYEMNVIFSCALETLPTLVSNNYQLTETRSSVAFKEDYFRSSKVYILAEFIKTFCDMQDGEFTPTVDLYKAFLVFNTTFGYDAKLEMTDFSRYIKRLPGIKVRRQRIDGHNIRGFSGLTLNDDAFYYVERSKNGNLFKYKSMDYHVTDIRVSYVAKPLFFVGNKVEKAFYYIKDEHEFAVKHGCYMGERIEENEAISPFIPADKEDEMNIFYWKDRGGEL